jgi:hypothetical protein
MEVHYFDKDLSGFLMLLINRNHLKEPGAG